MKKNDLLMLGYQAVANKDDFTLFGEVGTVE